MAIDYPWSEPPDAGETIEVAPGIRWLRMPLPFQLDHINLWLLEHGAGWAVVDTGTPVLPRITTNVSVSPERRRENPLPYSLDSLARFRAVSPAALVLPSRGLPFRGLHERLDALTQHHDARLAEAVDAVTEPR